MQGGHQVAQKLMNTTFPFREPKDTVSPCSSVNDTSGAVYADCCSDTFSVGTVSASSSFLACLLSVWLQAVKPITANMIHKKFVIILFLFIRVVIFLISLIY